MKLLTLFFALLFSASALAQENRITIRGFHAGMTPNEFRNTCLSLSGYKYVFFTEEEITRFLGESVQLKNGIMMICGPLNIDIRNFRDASNSRDSLLIDSSQVKFIEDTIYIGCEFFNGCEYVSQIENLARALMQNRTVDRCDDGDVVIECEKNNSIDALYIKSLRESLDSNRELTIEISSERKLDASNLNL